MGQRPTLGFQRVNPTWLKIVRTIASNTLAKFYLRVYCEGARNVPDTGACLVASNHFSGLDPFLIGMVIDRPIYYLGKIEMFRGPIFTWILKSLGCVPIDRSTLDTSAVRTVLQLIHEGELIGIAPEGTRSRTGEVLPFTYGVTKLALRTQTPIVPVAVYGTRELMPPGATYFRPGKVYIKFGELFDLSASYHERITPELLEKNTAIIRQKVVDLFEQIRVRPLK
jgi:1-acyl-sn-glycerol-3-phosphate acyltransferase